MASQKLSTQVKQQIAKNNLIETLGHDFSDFGEDFKQQVKTNVKAAPQDVLGQLLGMDRFEDRQSEKHSGELKAGEELTLPKKAAHAELADAPAAKMERKAHIEAGIDYFAQVRRSSERSSNRHTREVEQKIQQIVEQLQRLVKSTNTVMQIQYAEISVGQTPATPGEYHINYFSWLLSVIESARQKVEDSGAYLASLGKKGSKRGYWGKFKNQGTSFSQSGERQVATQTG